MASIFCLSGCWHVPNNYLRSDTYILSLKMLARPKQLSEECHLYSVSQDVGTSQITILGAARRFCLSRCWHVPNNYLRSGTYILSLKILARLKQLRSGTYVFFSQDVGTSQISSRGVTPIFCLSRCWHVPNNYLKSGTYNLSLKMLARPK